MLKRAVIYNEQHNGEKKEKESESTFFFLSKFVFEFRDGFSHAVSRNIGLAPEIVAFVMCRTFDHILEN